MARFSPYRNVRPNFLIFDGKTDEKGRLYVDFRDRPALYNSNDEIAVDKMNMDSKAINNLKVDDALVFKLHDSKQSKDYVFEIKNCRIVTVEDLILEVRKALVEEGLNFRLEVDRMQKKLSIYLGRNKFSIPLRVAKILNLTSKEGKISLLWKAVNDDVAVLKIDKDHLELDGENKSSDAVFTVPIDLEKNIWNEICDSSFQSILLHSDIVVPEFVGSQQVNILANFTYREKEDTSFYDVHNHQWRRLSVDRIRKCFVQFSDSTGKPFEDVYCYLVCRLRKRSPF